MSVRLTSGERKVALFDSASGFAFGPVFDEHDEAESFIGWLDNDARTYTAAQLEDLHNEWRTIYDGISA